MKQKTITALKQLFENEQLSREEVEILKSDKRKGVQQLIDTYEKKKQQQIELEQHFLKMCHYEQSYYDKGLYHIAGVDEAGRGPLAGPVVAAAVILPKQFKLLGLNDSKQLNETTREYFYKVIREQAVSYGITIISNEEIDEINIYEATKKAMTHSINKLAIQPDHVLVDAVTLDSIPYSTESLVKGDQKSISIAAASILAKVTRDRLMRDIHHQYPKYHFDRHMGYGTKLHFDMLKKYGPSPVHRKTFSPVRKLIDA